MTTAVATRAPTPKPFTIHHSDATQNWRMELIESFRAYEVQDGEIHPAENIITTAIQEQPFDILRQLADMAVDETDAITAYGILHSLPHVDVPWTDKEKAALIQRALSSPNIIIRDAGIRAAENWPSPEALAELENHREADPFLEEYATFVSTDIRATIGCPVP